MDLDLSADIGIPVYKSVSDSEDSEDAEPAVMMGQSRRSVALPTRLSQESIVSSRRPKPLPMRLSQQSIVSSSLSFSWLPTLLTPTSSASKTAAWGSQLPSFAPSGSSGSDGRRSSSASPIAVPDKPKSGCHSLDFVIRPSQDRAAPSGNPLDAERSQSREQTRSRYSRIRLMIFFMLEDPFGSRHAIVASALFMLAIFAGIALSFLEYTSLCRDQESGCRLSVSQWTICGFYTIEVLLRFWCCPSASGFFTYLPNVVDACNSIECWLSVVIPLSSQTDWPVIKLMRHFEAGLRLLKLCRYSSSWQLLCATLMDSAPALLLPIAAYVILVTLGAGLLLVAERSTATSKATIAGTVPVSGLYDAVLFCMLILGSTQTGPFNGLDVQSSVGNVIVGILMVCGHIIFAMPITIIGTCFCRTWFQRDRVLFTKVVKRRLKWQGEDVSETLHQLFNRFTSDDSDVLGLDEFYRFVAAIIPRPNKNQVLALFSTFDQDQDGYIGFPDLHASIYPEVANLDLCSVFMADAPGNDNTDQYQSAAESDAASESQVALDDEFGVICKTMMSFERRLLEMLEQCLRLLERDQHTLATAPWVSPAANSSLAPRREHLMRSSSRTAGSVSTSLGLPAARESLMLGSRSCPSPSLLRKPSGSASFSQRPSGVSSFNPRSSTSSAFTMSSLWSLLPSPSSRSSVHSGRLLPPQSSSCGQVKSGSNTARSSACRSEGIGFHLDSSAPEQQAAGDEHDLASNSKLPQQGQINGTDHRSFLKLRSLLKLPEDGREQVRSASTSPSQSRRASQGSALGNGRPTLKRQATLTRIRNRSTMEEEDELTPALQPRLSGQLRLLTACSSPKSSPKVSPRLPLSISNSLNLHEELPSWSQSHLSSTALSVSLPTSPSSSSTMAEKPVSMQIPRMIPSRWKTHLRERVMAAKSKVSDHARRWGGRSDKSAGQFCGTPSSAPSSESAHGLV